MSSAYDEAYFRFVSRTAMRSARQLLPILIERVIRPRSVLDVGCGRGVWLAAWMENRVTEYLGLDGAYVNQNALAIPQTHFRIVDLTDSWRVERRFDLVQSLEVAEHLPADCGPDFVKRLCAHSDVVLFSAAQPGQGGEHHVNERELSYWAGLFSRQGYDAFDCIRPLVANNKMIDPWYRFNIIVYANSDGSRRLSPAAIVNRVADLSNLDPGGDIFWRLWRSMVRPFPEPFVTFVASRFFRE